MEIISIHADAYMLYAGLFTDPGEALNFFARKRSSTNWGVTGPSQLRYVKFFNLSIAGAVHPREQKPLYLSYIHLSHAPAMSKSYYYYNSGVCSPFLHIYSISSDDNKKKLIYSSENVRDGTKTYASNEPIDFLDINLWLIGDILVEIYHETPCIKQKRCPLAISFRYDTC